MEKDEGQLVEVEEYQKYYGEIELWGKLKKVTKKAGIKVVYAALLLYYTLKSSELDLQTKASILGALGYLILPLDLVPDFMPLVGLADDLAALLFTVGQVSNHLTPEIRFKAKDKLGEWFGEYDEAELADVEGAEEH